MGKFTEVARQQVLSRLQDIQKGVQVGDDDPFGQFGAFGCLLVRDLRKNSYFTWLVPGINVDQHAEDQMYEQLRINFGSYGLPFNAKVIFFCTKSPCRQCTERMLDEVEKVANLLFRSGHQCYFSFVFKNWFVVDRSRDNTPPKQIWKSTEDARQEYRRIEEQSGGLITIRHYGFTKGVPNGEHVKINRPSFDLPYDPFKGTLGL